MPLSEAEVKEAEQFDADRQAGKIPGAPPSIPPNDELLIKFFMLGNYIVCRDGFLTAIQTLRPLFSQQPGPVEEAKSSWTSDDPQQVLRRGGLVSHTDTSKANEEISRSTQKLVKETTSIVEKAQRNTAFVDLKRVIDGVLVNSRIPGLVDRAGSVRARIDRWEAAKVNFPERIADIDKEIAREQAKLR
jgi:hypothetical protein